MFRRLLAPLGAILLTTWLSAQTALPIDSELHIGQLDNGITYYVRPIPSGSGRVCLRLAVPVGSVVEEDDEQGVAHFLEHLLFHGTESFPRENLEAFLASAGARLGADYNAFTGFDETVYMLDIPADELRLEQAICLLSEWASTARLEERAVEEERGIVIEEWRRGLGAGTTMLEEALAALAEGSPYAVRLPIGLENVIRSVPAETIRSFYERWYLAAPVGVVAVGDIDADGVVQMIKRYFGELEPRVEADELPHFAIPSQDGPRFTVTHYPEFGGAMVGFLFKGDHLAQQTLNDLRQHLVTRLALDMLNEVLRSETRVYSEATTFPFIADQQATVIDASCSVGEIETAVTQITRVLSTIWQHSLPEELFHRVVKEKISQLRLELEGKGTLLRGELADACVNHFLHKSALCGVKERAQLVAQLLEEISLEEIQARILQWNPLDDCVVQITVPPDAQVDTDALLWLIRQSMQEETLPLPGLPPLPALMDWLPKPGLIAEESYLPGLELTELILGNGMRVCLRPVPEDQGVVLLSGTAFGGLSDLDDESFLDGRLAEALLEGSGIGGLEPDALFAALTGKQAFVSRAISHYTRNLHGHAMAGDETTLFQLLHLIFTAQVNQGWMYDSLVAGFRGAANAGESFSDAIHSIVTGDHPHFRTPTEEDFDNAYFEAADSLALSAFSNPAEFTLFIAGDFDLDAIKELIQIYLASIPPTGPPSADYTRLAIRFPEGITEASVYAGTEPQSVVQIMLPLSIRQPTPEKLAIVDAACNIIHGRIFDLLREDLSATYFVDCDSFFLYPDTLFGGSLEIQFSCDPRDADLLAGMAVRELRLLSERGPLAEEVADEVSLLQRRIQTDLTQGGFWASELTRYTEHEWRLEGLLELHARPEALTKAAIRERLEQMLTLDTYAVVVLYPEPN